MTLFYHGNNQSTRLSTLSLSPSCPNSSKLHSSKINLSKFSFKIPQFSHLTEPEEDKQQETSIDKTKKSRPFRCTQHRQAIFFSLV